MSSPIKKLAGQTAIYGLSSIAGRLLNYFLVPLYTRVFLPEEYGVVNELYSYAALLMIVFTYGMETGYFRFSVRGDDPKKVFGTSALSLIFSTCAIALILISFASPIAGAMHYGDHPEYITWFVLMISFDTLASIPFAKLRQMNRPVLFATLKLFNIGVNVVLNLFWLVACPYVLNHWGDSSLARFVHLVYDPALGVSYVFLANLIASGLTMLAVIPFTWAGKISFSKKLWREMMVYSLPVLIIGAAGMVNETFDRILLKWLLPGSPKEALAQIGIYSACYKLSLFMQLFVQAYRMAAEPFFFNQSKQDDAKRVYAVSMKYFVIVCSLILLGIMLYLDLFKHFVGREYYGGLIIVPVSLFANIFLGIYYNLSLWYKLTDKTHRGMLISLGGAAVSLALNIALIPVLGFTGAAWARFACYGLMMVASYFQGQKFYPVPYDLKRMGWYAMVAVAFCALSFWGINSLDTGIVLRLALNSVLMILFLLMVLKLEAKGLRNFLKK